MLSTKTKSSCEISEKKHLTYCISYKNSSRGLKVICSRPKTHQDYKKIYFLYRNNLSRSWQVRPKAIGTLHLRARNCPEYLLF